MFADIDKFKEEEAVISLFSSKGNQFKIHIDKFWYKTDFFGYEGAAEYFTSEILKHSNVSHENFVTYDLCHILYEDKVYTGCRSECFADDSGKELNISKNITTNEITLAKFLRLMSGDVLYFEKIAGIPSLEDRIVQVVTDVERYTGLNEFGKYLTCLFELDAFTLNEDRHFNNISILCKKSRQETSYNYCPIFDNGAAFLSDIKQYSMDIDAAASMKKVRSKPFAVDFADQLNACHRLYGRQLYLSDFNRCKVLVPIRDMYGLEVALRINRIFDIKKKELSYLFDPINLEIQEELER